MVPQPLVLLTERLVQLEDVLAPAAQWTSRLVTVVERHGSRALTALLLTEGVYIVAYLFLLFVVRRSTLASVIGVDELRCIGQAIIVDLVDGRSLELAERVGFETTGTIQEVPLLPAAILTGFGE